MSAQISAEELAELRRLEGVSGHSEAHWWRFLEALGTHAPALLSAAEAHLSDAAEIARLTRERDEAWAALRGVTPSFRRVGQCWCGRSRDVGEFGHTEACKLARAALPAQPEARAEEPGHG